MTRVDLERVIRPLNAIMGYSDLMLPEDLSEENSDYLKTIKNSGSP